MAAFSRSDDSTLGRWWWTVDRWTLSALLALIAIGYVMMLAASPAVAERIGTASRHTFFIKQVAYLAMAAGVIVVVSLLSPRNIRRLALLGFVCALLATIATLVIGVEIKGARRWLPIPFLSLQPSEFLKPCFAVVAAWLIAEGRAPGSRLPGMLITICLFLIVGLVLKSQPDIGMLFVVTMVLFAQIFVAGINLFLIGAAGALAVGMGAVVYLTRSHVRDRVAAFFNPTCNDRENYQICTAMEAFGNGGLLGRGPGEGRLKNVLPDAHADFVFAVAGEEFGMVVCLMILGLFLFVVVRGLLKLLSESDLFVVLAAAGLLTQFGLQAFINMASTLHLIPTKGMTLPFVSYGGSSVIAIALGMGMLLALTRRRPSRTAGAEA